MFDTVICRVHYLKKRFFWKRFFRKMSKVKSASFFEFFSMTVILLEMLRISHFSVLPLVIHFRKTAITNASGFCCIFGFVTNT